MAQETASSFNEDTTLSIIELCLELDQLAVSSYARIAASTECESLKAFWLAMAAEEHEHIEYWKLLQQAGRETRFPTLFDDAQTIKAHLQASVDKIRAQAALWEPGQPLSAAFLLACRMETTMLHPAFTNLFAFFASLLQIDFAYRYDSHVDHFLCVMRRYCSENPGLELAAEVVLSLWQTNQQITHQATHDDLTRLLNRRAFWLLARHQAYLSQRQGLPLGIMMLDVDDFRAVNEAHGHLAGDRALRVVGLLLEQRLRKSDVVARYGGEEFVVLCSGSSPDGLLRVAEELRQGIAALDVDGVRVTVSIGLSYGAIVANADRALEALIAAADEALYQAKHAGKNRVVQPVSV